MASSSRHSTSLSSLSSFLTPECGNSSPLQNSNRNGLANSRRNAVDHSSNSPSDSNANENERGTQVDVSGRNSTAHCTSSRPTSSTYDSCSTLTAELRQFYRRHSHLNISRYLQSHVLVPANSPD